MLQPVQHASICTRQLHEFHSREGDTYTLWRWADGNIPMYATYGS